MIDAGLSVQPKAAPLYLARGILYVQLADYDHADADFEKANELDSHLALTEAAQGMIAEQRNDLDKALAVVRAKLAKRPNDALLLYVQADILLQKNPDTRGSEFRQAVASARKAANLQPSLVYAHDTLAKLYLEAGQNQQAVAHLLAPRPTRTIQGPSGQPAHNPTRRIGNCEQPRLEPRLNVAGSFRECCSLVCGP